MKGVHVSELLVGFDSFKMHTALTIAGVFTLFSTGSALRYEQQYMTHNLNQNVSAINPLDYGGTWENHTYHASPANWRMPFYTVC